MNGMKNGLGYLTFLRKNKRNSFQSPIAWSLFSILMQCFFMFGAINDYASLVQFVT